jgi:hypothetical protein
LTFAPLVIGPESASDESRRSSEGARDEADTAEQAADGTYSPWSDGVASLATLADAAEPANHYASRSKSQATINAYAAG